MIAIPYSRAAAATALRYYRRVRRYRGGGVFNPDFNGEQAEAALETVSRMTPCPLWLYLADESIFNLTASRRQPLHA